MAFKAILESEADGDNNAAGGGGDAGAQSAQPGNSSTDNSSTSVSSEQTPSSAGSQGESGGGEAGKVAAADEKPKSALDAVLKVLKKPEGDTSKPQPKAGEQAAAGDKTAVVEATVDEHKAAGEGEKDWISHEEYRKLPPVVRRRISNLTTQRNEARDESKALQPRAKARDDLVSFCQHNKVSPEDLTFGLEFLALIRMDPSKAYEKIAPVMRDLQAHVGEILPNDLQKAVEDGKLSEEHAKELANARRERARLEHRSTEQTEEQRRETAQRSYDSHVTTTTDAIKAWENSWKASDPDYQKKAERVWERLQVKLHEATAGGTKLLKPEDTVKLANQAKKDVESWLGELLPKPREIKPGPTGGSPVTTTKKPSSALEAAQLAVAATRAAA